MCAQLMLQHRDHRKMENVLAIVYGVKHQQQPMDLTRLPSAK